MTAPRFDLALAGVAGFTRTCLTLPKRKISRDPLSGVLDGVNKTFHTTYFPLQTSGSLVVYQGADSVSGTADFDTGEITLASVPAQQPLATYTFLPYTTTQMAAIVVAGFYEMEGRWARGWKLVDGSGNAATESSAAIYIADQDGLEPVLNGREFTDVSVQMALLAACTEYAFYRMSWGESALSDYSFRETTKGMSVDKSRRPANLRDAVQELNDEIERILEQAQTQSSGGANYGGYVANLSTRSYMLSHEWQTESALLSYRTTLAYTQPTRSF